MSKQKLTKFRDDLKKYRDLLRNSSGISRDIESNVDLIDRLQSSLTQQFAVLEDEIRAFSRGPMYTDPVWRVSQDAYFTALSNDILLRRGPAIEAILNDLDYVIAKYESNKIPKARGDLSISLGLLHPKIIEHCESRFESGHYSDAILTAYKVVLNEIKLITGLDMDGKPLVEKAMSLNSPIIKLNDLKTQSDKDEQLGFMLLLSGAALGIRNPKAHDLIPQDDPIRTLQYISFASLLLNRLDGRIEPKPGISHE